MIDQFVKDPVALGRLHAGPMGPYIDSFASLLSEEGYATSTAKQQIRVVGDLSRWLNRRRVELDELNERIVAKFLEYRRRRVRVHRVDTPTLQKFLEHLRQVGVIPGLASQIDESPLHRVESAFTQYLTQERGLSQKTVANYLPVVHRFLSERFGKTVIRLADLRPPDSTRFILRYARTVNRGNPKVMVTALRSFFGFLRLRGDIATDLAASVPTVANWCLSSLPKSLAPEQVERVLRSCNQTTATGQRDYAILLLLARLGLRAAEVVAMRLDDINWDASELTVRGKGSRQDRLPIPQDVGEALARYLCHGRPRCSTRRVFVRMIAPRRGFAKSGSISTIVQRALARAGLDPPHKGAHLLRHSLATQMLQEGASLTEIGEILRHQHPNTTQIYTKVDLGALRALAQPWPGDRS